jgi:DNA-binding response OmpR family regulator
VHRRSVVLVVDDQAMTRDLVGAMLEHDEIEVHTAPDGPTAVSMAETIRPDIVLLDVMMPGEDGFDVCRTLRSSESAPRVVMLTGRSDEAARAAAEAAGAEAYLVKPFSAFDLFRLVRGEPARGA